MTEDVSELGNCTTADDAVPKIGLLITCIIIWQQKSIIITSILFYICKIR